MFTFYRDENRLSRRRRRARRKCIILFAAIKSRTHARTENSTSSQKGALTSRTTVVAQHDRSSVSQMHARTSTQKTAH